MRSALVEPNWESLDNWIYWVVGMCVHGQDRHISKIRWLFDINGESLVFTSYAGTEEEDYPGLPEAIAETFRAPHSADDGAQRSDCKASADDDAREEAPLTPLQAQGAERGGERGARRAAPSSTTTSSKLAVTSDREEPQ